MTRRQSKFLLLHALFLVTGACGLGYQMVWSRMFTLGLGCELPAILAVTAAFFGGLALGAWFLDKPVNLSEAPGKWYAGLEFLIGCWGLISAWLIPEINHLAPRLIGLEPTPLRHWAVAFAIPGFVLLPATFAMGATLSAAERFACRYSLDGQCAGSLYAANTLGGVAGVGLAAFVLMPALGLRLTLGGLSAVTLLCGAAVLALHRSEAVDPASRRALGAGLNPSAAQIGGADGTSDRPARAGLAHPADIGSGSERPGLPAGRLLWTAFFMGLLGIGFEVLGLRLLSHVLENTIFSYAAALAIYLLGTAVGAAAAKRLSRRLELQRLLARLLIGLAAACLLGVSALIAAPVSYQFARQSLGDSTLGVFLAECGVAITVFGPATVCMGAIFSLLAQAARGTAGGIGHILACNTVGGAVAPVLFGLVLLPLMGSKWALVIVCLGYLFLVPSFNRSAQRASLLLAGLALLLPKDLRLVQLLPGERILAFREGVFDSAAILESQDGHRLLRINNRFGMGGTASAFAERREAHIPLLLHPAPKRALFLGAGTGITLGSALAHPGLEADGVELSRDVASLTAYFEKENALAEWRPRLRLTVADARRFIRSTSSGYDVIVADLFHPARDGAGNLYTREHFQALRARLAPGGLCCQWLPLYQLDETTLRIITRTFLEVFPDARAFILRFNLNTPVVGLVGGLESRTYSADWLERRATDPNLVQALRPLVLTDTWQLLGCFVAGPQALQDFAGNAPVNTDDHPWVTFRAPRFAYQRQSTAYGRLFTMLALKAGRPEELLAPGAGSAQDFARLAVFIHARDTYLEGLRAESQGRLAEAINGFLQSARLSEDFNTGYAYGLTLAAQLAKSNPAEARALLERLIEVRPQQSVARGLLDRLKPE